LPPSAVAISTSHQQSPANQTKRVAVLISYVPPILDPYANLNHGEILIRRLFSDASSTTGTTLLSVTWEYIDECQAHKDLEDAAWKDKKLSHWKI
jgi:hypothetical protein